MVKLFKVYVYGNNRELFDKSDMEWLLDIFLVNCNANKCN